MLKNHSIQYSIQFFYKLFIQRNYSFIFFKELFIQKIIQLEKNYSKKYSFKKIENYSFKKIIHFFEKLIIAQG